MRAFDELLEESVAFHGHLCPGQVLGVRMVTTGCRALEIDEPKRMGKELVIFVEIDRCATDAIQALTGVSLGKRTLKFFDYGKMAVTFIRVDTGAAVRVVAREEARDLARLYAPAEQDLRKAMLEAYRVMPDEKSLQVGDVSVEPRWLDRQRVRVPCERCGEGINYKREVKSNGLTLCRPCSGEAYFVRAQRAQENEPIHLSRAM
jgi:formylmethanofuran dehydrogenase subunit E